MRTEVSTGTEVSSRDLSSVRRGDGKELVTTLQSLRYLHHTRPFQCQMASFRKGPIGIGRHQAGSSHLLTGSDIGIQLNRAG